MMRKLEEWFDAELRQVPNRENLGNVLTDSGLQVSDDQVEAIVNGTKAKVPIRALEIPWFGSFQALQSLPAHYGI